MTSLHTSNLNSTPLPGPASPLGKGGLRGVTIGSALALGVPLDALNLALWLGAALAIPICMQVAPAYTEDESLCDPKTYASLQAITTTDSPSNYSMRAIRSYGNRLWVGNDHGLAVLEDGKWRNWTLKDGLPARRVQCIEVDPQTNDVWIGTLGGGLARFTAGRFDVFNQFNSGLAGDLVFAVAIGNGRIWASTNGGVSSYDPVADDWDLLAERRADAAFFVPTALAFQDDALYAVFRHLGVCRWDAAAHQWTPGAPRDENRALHDGLAQLGSQATSHPKTPSSSPLSPTVRKADEARTSPPHAIGVYGPRTRRIALPGDEQPSRPAENFPEMLAVQLAVESVNAAGGFRGATPFQLINAMPGYAKYGWGLPEDDMVFFADDPNVIGLVAGTPPDQAITDTTVAYLKLPVVSTAPDIENTKTGYSRNPWLFPCRGDEPARHRVLLDHIAKNRNLVRFAIITTAGQSSRPPACWWSKYARILKLPTPFELSWDPAKPEALGAVVKALRDSDAQVILTWCDAREALTLLRGIRAAGLLQLFAARPEIMPDPIFSDGGSDAGEVVTMPVATSAPAQPDDPHALPQRPRTAPEGASSAVARFASKYADQSFSRGARTPPGANALRSFDATDHLLAAINIAGPDRESVRSALADLEESPFGEEHFERAHGASTVVLATFENGQWVYRSVTAQPPPVKLPPADAPH